MAMHSLSTKPSAPSNVGTLPSLLIFRYSSGTPLAGSVWTYSMSSPFSFATALRAVVRGLPCEESETKNSRAIIVSAFTSSADRDTYGVAVDLAERHDCQLCGREENGEGWEDGGSGREAGGKVLWWGRGGGRHLISTL